MPDEASIVSPMAGKKNQITATERMLNLVALLSESNAPLTLEQITIKMRGQYPEKGSGQRTAFERDKKSLRALGIPIVTRSMGGDDAGRTAYSIDRSGYALIDFGLTQEEMDALEQAAAMVQIGTTWGKQAVQWLGGEVTDADAPTAVRIGGSSNVLPVVWQAVTSRQVLKFPYRAKARTVHPYGLLARNGFWYLIGLDLDRGAQVVYRVDRIEAMPEAGEEGAFERPSDFDLATAYERDAKTFSDGDSEMAVVRLDRRVAPAVVRELDPDAVIARRGDGSVDVEVACGNKVAFESWLFAMVDRAEVIGPGPVREHVIARLRGMAGGAK